MCPRADEWRNNSRIRWLPLALQVRTTARERAPFQPRGIARGRANTVDTSRLSKLPRPHQPGARRGKGRTLKPATRIGTSPNRHGEGLVADDIGLWDLVDRPVGWDL